MLFFIVWLLGLTIYILITKKWNLWGKTFLFFGLFVVTYAFAAAEGGIGDYIHLAVKYPEYAKKIARSPDRTSKPISFQWEGSGFVTASTDRGLIYDATGETAKKVGKNFCSEDEEITDIHLIGKFYLVNDLHAEFTSDHCK